MDVKAYYNEIDPYAAQWLRNLIAAGHIAPGDVDERSIVDVRPVDLVGYTQCHFFAGIGVWSHSLRHAGWPDDRAVWTGSCPCQPFSGAGKGDGFDDERHLWPAFFHLIEQCKPAVVFGEQVASKDGLAWLDLVQADMEGSDYAFGALDLCAAGFGAPHIRQRLYWLADADCQDQGGRGIQRPGQGDGASAGSACERSAGLCAVGGLGDTNSTVSEQSARRWARPDEAQGAGAFGELDGPGDADALADASDGQLSQPGRGSQERNGNGSNRADAGASRLADACSERRQQIAGSPPSHEAADGRAGRDGSKSNCDHVFTGNGANVPASPTNGLWRDADWLLCRDDKWRAVEPGTFPLAHGVAGRVGRLRAYGNAIVAPQAKEFIAAYIGSRP